jgi:cysteine synthase
MPILNNPLDLLFSNLFFELDGLSGSARLLLKLEGYNVTGSIKIKPALFMIDDLERRGLLEPHRSTIVESSSGNIGTALALICCRRGYEFICVTDPNISPFNRRSIEAYGGRVIIVDRKDTKGGYLENRIECIRSLLKENRDYVWLNQYANPYNLRAHEEWTALEILGEVPNVDYLYVGTGTTGTIMGLARRFAELSPATRVVAVEPEGSVTFDPGRSGACAPCRLRPRDRRDPHVPLGGPPPRLDDRRLVRLGPGGDRSRRATVRGREHHCRDLAGPRRQISRHHLLARMGGQALRHWRGYA